MATANERLFDLALRHQIDLRRFTVGEVKKILRLLEAIDADVTKRLRRDLVGLADGTPLSFTPDPEQRFRLLLQLQLLGGSQPLAAQGRFRILEAGGELDEQGLLLIQLLLALHPLILQLVEAILQRLMALLHQHQFLSLRRGRSPPDQPTKPEGQHGGRQQDPPEPGVDHLRLR